MVVLALKKVKKKFTNHGVRKTTVRKLTKANLIYCNFRIYHHCQKPQRYKFPQRLQWSRRRRATMTLSCNIQMNNKNPSAEKKTNIILILAEVSDITTTVAPLTHLKKAAKAWNRRNQKKNENAYIRWNHGKSRANLRRLLFTRFSKHLFANY